jgi:transposase
MFFQIHGRDASGKVIVAKALRRTDMLAFFTSLPLCLVGMEACGLTATGAITPHYFIF